MTSQIFANIYLNEFDRYVRHTLKPRGYVRYGDDFVLFFDDKNEAQKVQTIASKWLEQSLDMYVHHNNNVVLPARAGLHFLGHRIYPDSPLTVDRAMLRKIERDINYGNLASYKAMALPKRFARRLPWHMLN